MIRRIRQRHDFERLRRDGARIRATHLWSVWCPDPTAATTSVAYAIGRATGTAVVRNRLRRRLRAIVRELDRRQPFPPGLLLIGPTQKPISELTFDQLLASMTTMIDEIRRRPTPTDGSRR